MLSALHHSRTGLRSDSSATLCSDGQKDYTRILGLATAILALILLPAATATTHESSPRELYEALAALRVDAKNVYEVRPANRIELRRADLLLSFDLGKLAFFEPFEGQITGVVFSGRGHALAAPRGLVEKQQLARFLGAPLLDQDFSSLCLRFSDDTAADLLRQLQNAALTPQEDQTFTTRWSDNVVPVNPTRALRLVFNAVSQNPRPFVSATINGAASGSFDFVLDAMRDEPFLLGQFRKSAAGPAFYDIWASYKIPGISPPPVAFHALRYNIDTSLLPDTSLEGQTQVLFRTELSGERLLIFQLSRMLNVTEVTAESGQPLTFFQNEGISFRDRSTRGNDRLYVILPEPPARGSQFTLRFRYRGNVIEDAGNGVLFVGARESWYPHFGDAADFADYDLIVRWPRRLRVVATGAKIEEYSDGDMRVGHWRTEKPASVAGFNVGEYASSSFKSATHSVDVYANPQLEQALNKRLSAPDDLARVQPPFGPEGTRSTNLLSMPSVLPAPTDALQQLAREIDSSMRFYETFSGPYPFHGLSVSQIPGSFGQGWPGLLYLSTFSFLPPAAQQRAGLSEFVQEHFSELIPFHEVAHQWWGNIVGWSGYRDQWIDEGIANYLALLFVDHQKGASHSLHVWLTRYRKHLLEKRSDSDLPGSEIGALDLGNRLSSSKSPGGFEQVIYSKGTWVMHMLREMLRQPGAKDPDARFTELLHTLVTKYAYRGLSTADLQREVEAVMTPGMDLEGGRSMDWFFEQWVRGTGVPRYRVEFSSHSTDKGVVVRGKLFQEGVPRSFIAPVPLYTTTTAGHTIYLGTVTTMGPETPFRFTTPASPHKILIDPQMTLLCVTD